MIYSRVRMSRNKVQQNVGLENQLVTDLPNL
jgi:hypothetical protein